MKVICLVEVSNGGHREAFMQLFIKALIETDNYVICIMPDTTIVYNWMLRNYSEYTNRVTFYQINYPHNNITKFSRWTLFIRAINVWKFYKTELQKIERLSKHKFDLIYWNCLDGYIFNYFPAFVVDIIFPYKWSGLFFHPNYLRRNSHSLNQSTKFFDIDNCLKAKKCIAVAIHDEGILQKFEKRIDKKVILFPETADATPPNKNLPLAIKIKESAKGRTIVGIIGLEPYKGSYALSQIVNIADPNKYFFVFTGIFLESYLSKLKTIELTNYNSFIQNMPENCLWQTGTLKEGEEYNSIFCSFDIVYIMYKNFYSSSNRLTKAAIFNKLVLGNNYGCVGDDIPTYQLGETADEDDIEEQYQKLEILREKIINNDLPFEQWKIYAAKHNTDRLKEKFEELLALL